MKPLTNYEKILMTEMMIGSAIGLTMTGLMSWIIFHKYDAVPMWGAKGFVADMTISTFIPVFGAFIAIGLITRQRVGAGRLTHEMQSNSRNGSFRWLPNIILLQAAFFAISVAGICAALCALIVISTGATSIDFAPFMVIKLILGAAVGLGVAPFTIIMTLANMSRTRSKF